MIENYWLFVINSLYVAIIFLLSGLYLSISTELSIACQSFNTNCNFSTPSKIFSFKEWTIMDPLYF